MSSLQGDSSNVSMDAVLGTNAVPDGTAAGVHGISKNTGPGVLGESVKGRGVQGISVENYGVRAHSDNIAGLRASSAMSRAMEGWGVKDDGVWGISKEANGVHGVAEGNKAGVAGESKAGRGVQGVSESGQGVYGKSHTNAGVVGESDLMDGVYGVSHDPARAGVSGHNLNNQNKPNTNGLAGFFEGNVVVTGTITAQGDIFCGGADFAEDFDVIEETEPGEVMVLTDTGALEPSKKPYDRKVVGVISGAGNYKPGIILDKQKGNDNRMPVAIMGKVYCKVDADAAPIETGDMLTTSHITGYAMKATDPFQSFGAVIGKALASLKEGKGLIPILVVLQ